MEKVMHEKICRTSFLGGPVVYPEFTIKPVTAHPALLIDPSDVPAVKKRYEAIPGHAAPNMRGMSGEIQGLLYGDEAFKKKLSADWMADRRKQFGDPKVIPPYRRYSEAIYAYDVIASFGYVTEQDKADFRTMMVRGATHYIGDDPAKFPSKATPLNDGIEYPTGFANGNRWVGANNDVAFVGTGKAPSTPPTNLYITNSNLQTTPGGKALAFYTSPTVDYAVADCSRNDKRFFKPEDAFT
jgi:hypothetical protein